MSNLRLIDKSFDITKSLQYNLSIRFSPDGFSFCIANFENRLPVVLFNTDFNAQTTYQLKNELNQVLLSENLLKTSYAKTRIAYLSGENSLMPHSLIEEQEQKKMFAFTNDTSSDNEIMFQEISKLNACIGFTVPVILKEFFDIHFQNHQFIPHNLPLIIKALESDQKSPSLWVQKHNHMANILAMQNKQLLGINTFYVKDETDLLYYTLGMSKHVFNDDQTSIVYFSGDLDYKSSFFDQLKRYGFKPEFMRLSETISRNHGFHLTNDQQYTLLIEQALCE